MRKSLRHAALIASVLLLSLPASVRADQQDDFDSMQSGDIGPRGFSNALNAAQTAALAQLLQAALCDADAAILVPVPAAPPAGAPPVAPAGAPAAPLPAPINNAPAPPAAAPGLCDPDSAASRNPPDAAYVQALRKSLETRAQGADADVAAAVAAFLPPIDQELLASPIYDANTRALYIDQLASLGALASNAGNQNPPAGKSRIIGGSTLVDAKDVVLLTNTRSGTPSAVCTGTIVSDTSTGPQHGQADPGTVILTAAHCVCDWLGNQQLNSMVMSVRMGVTRSNDVDFAAVEIRRGGIRLMDGVTCPAAGGDVRAATAGKDLAVLTTANSISSRFGKARAILSPTGYAQWRSSRNSSFVRIGGYGRSTTRDARDPATRNFVDLTVSSYDCVHPTHDKCTPALEFVAAGAATAIRNSVNVAAADLTDTDRAHVGTCNGDSGGPVYASQSAANDHDKFYLVGTVRGGPEGCGVYSTLSLLSLPRTVCWLKKATSDRVSFVLADGTKDMALPTCI